MQNSTHPRTGPRIQVGKSLQYYAAAGRRSDYEPHIKTDDDDYGNKLYDGLYTASD